MPQAAPFLISAGIGILLSAAQVGLSTALGGKKKNQGFGQQVNSSAQKQNVTATYESIPIMYGRNRVGCNPVFYHSKKAYSGREMIEGVELKTEGMYLYGLYSICEGEINDIIDAYIDDVPASDAVFDSKFKCNLTFNFTFDEPDEFLLIGRNNPIIVGKAGYWYQSSYVSGGFVLPENWIFKPYRYKLSREPLNGGSRKIVLEFEGGTSNTHTITIDNADYGEYTYYLEYLTDENIYIPLWEASLNTTKYNDDYILYNTIVSQGSLDEIIHDSKIDGEYLRAEYRLGEPYQEAIQFFVDEIGNEADTINLQNAVGERIAFAGMRFLKHTMGSKATSTAVKGIPTVLFDLECAKVWDPRLSVSEPILYDNGDPILDDNGEQIIFNHEFTPSDVPSRASYEQTKFYLYTTNPALLLLDYLCRAQIAYDKDIDKYVRIPYGCDISLSKINLQSFIDAANYCDELIEGYDGNMRKRYQCNITIDRTRRQVENVEAILESMNGRLADPASIYTLVLDKPCEDPDELPILDAFASSESKSLSGLSLNDKLNEIKIKFIDKDTNYEYNTITVSDDVLKAEDQDKVYSQEVELEGIKTKEYARQIGTYLLKKARNRLTFNFSTLYTKKWLAPGELVRIQYAPFGFVNKIFRIESIEQYETGLLNMVASEYLESDYNIYDLSISSSAVGTNFTSPFIINPPTNITISQSYGFNSNKEFVSRVNMSWSLSPNSSVKEFSIDMKSFGIGDWRHLGTTQSTNYIIENLPPGLYNLRIKAINNIGRESSYLEREVEVYKNLAPPPDVQNFIIENNNKSVLLSWDKLPHVANNGGFMIKHIPKISGAEWADYADLTLIVSGYETVATVDQLDGTYMIKAFNNANVFSNNASSIILDLPDNTEYRQVLDIICENDFEGEKIRTTVSDEGLQLSSKLTIDQMTTNIDTWTSIDMIGGLWNAGTYVPDQMFDLGGTYRFQLSKYILARCNSTSNADTIDSRKTNIDSWTSFDGESKTSNWAVTVLYSLTKDDPNSPSASWSEWNSLTVNEITARGVRFRVELVTASSLENIYIESMQFFCKIITKIVSNTSQVNATAGYRVYYDNYFYDIPEPIISIQNAQSGDYIEIVDKQNNYFSITIRDKDGYIVSRNITWSAQGLGSKII